MERHTAGDPISGLKWTHKTTKKIKKQLRKVGLSVSPKTVARLLKGLKFSLRVNHKKIAGKSSPHRNQQFEYIARMRQQFDSKRWPVISVDTKKKEMLGLFRNKGESWEVEPIKVRDHDFKRDSVGTAIPWGLYETQGNRGHVFVGTSHDTSTFAVKALTRWWKNDGQRRYPGAKKLLVLSDCGGSNGNRSRVFKYKLQTQFCDRFGVEITICHYPPGTSKWNPIEHRLFSEISKSWAGQPLDSYETVLKFIRTTKTQTGLVVKASMLKGEFPTGVKVSKDQMAEIKLRPHKVLPMWNYTMVPAGSKM